MKINIILLKILINFFKHFFKKMIETIKKQDYLPSTITVVSKLTQDLDVLAIAKFLPVIHLFDENDKRIKLISGTRNSIQYYGVENIIISVCYKKIRRGMRTGAMNNMVSLDIQYLKKNIHVKLSSNSITCVGTSGLDQGVSVFNIIKNYIYMLNDNISFSHTIKNKNQLLTWLFLNCIEDNKLLRLDKITQRIIKSNFNEDEIKYLLICSSYIEDVDELNCFKKKN